MIILIIGMVGSAFARDSFIVAPKKKKRVKVSVLKEHIADELVQVLRESMNMINDIVAVQTAVTDNTMQSSIKVFEQVQSTMNNALKLIKNEVEELSSNHEAQKKKVATCPTTGYAGLLKSSSYLLKNLAEMQQIIVENMCALLEGSKTSFLGTSKRKELQVYLDRVRGARTNILSIHKQLRTVQ